MLLASSFDDDEDDGWAMGLVMVGGDKCSICTTARPEKEETKVKKDSRFTLQRLVEHQWVIASCTQHTHIDDH
jgi:hypothetical protein